MTKTYKRKIKCIACGKIQTDETPFCRWVRNNPSLESREGITCYDVDMFIHRFKVGFSRVAQYLMFIEVKTHGAEPDEAQRDTLGFFNQFLRNRKSNIHRKANHQVEFAANLAYSKMHKRQIPIKAFGGHLLQFERECPEDSSWIKWDWKIITEQDLLKVFRFELDPDTLHPTDLRIHHRKPASLFKPEHFLMGNPL